MKNRLSTNTNLIVFNREHHMRSMLELIPIYARNDINLLDLNFCEMMNPISSLKEKESAKAYIDRLNEYKNELGVEYIQCHLPYQRAGQSLSELNDGIKLALEYVFKLDIPVSVIHPIKSSIYDNLEYFESLKGYIPNTTTLAIENMETENEIYSIEQLLEIISNLSYKAGICLDTGHANIMALDIPNFIRKAGKNLLATHINDNNAKSDQHLLPGFGNIEWEDVINALKEYYNGYLNYEAMFFSRNIPESLSNDIITLAKSIGSWLLGL